MVLLLSLSESLCTETSYKNALIKYSLEGVRCSELTCTFQGLKVGSQPHVYQLQVQQLNPTKTLARLNHFNYLTKTYTKDDRQLSDVCINRFVTGKNSSFE